ncbi:uncharacterized protein PRCAT00004062001 [Priceomyces carsonii]|uniref:uncharacterized protein n=1 Tax=Priceomyces carsonii TaxID=28549 RepID=UPI002ED8512B|nr:unnamed protein product [Priceomyces carsonii]
MKSCYFFIVALTFVVCNVYGIIHEDGFCAMYGDCGKKSIFGGSLPCPNSTEAVIPSTKSVELLKQICGDDFVTDKVCCTEEQISSLQSNLNKAEPIISSCPACRKNFFNFFCEFTCSPNQSKFINITKTATAIDTKKEIVTELDFFVNPEFADRFFNSCKEVKFLATNGYAMDLIGGGATNYQDFLKFLGDEKPLLGGSPFQMNFKYNMSKELKHQGLQLKGGIMRDCDDSEYKCACSDCSKSCPSLPRFKDFGTKCRVGKLPCFSFAVIIAWSCLVLIVIGYHVFLVRSTKFESEDIEDDTIFANTSLNTASKVSNSLQNLFLTGTKKFFKGTAFFCSSHPLLTILISLAVSFSLSLGLLKLNLEKDPVNLWVSPQEPALHELNYFEDNFGEWYRIEQLIVSSPDDQPILNWDNIKWWFEKELELQKLDGVSLTDLCFKPLGETCAVESFTQYFQGDIGNLNENNWRQKLQGCTDSPVNCLPTFQQPLKKNLLFDNDDIFNARAFVVTILINNDLKDSNYTSMAVDYEHGFQKWVSKIRQESKLRFSFSTEVSLTEELNKSTNTDIKVIVISYLLMFLYASLALGRKFPTTVKALTETKFLLGLSGIIIILLSVTSSAGFFSFIGLKSTLIIAEVIPFLILAVGIDNIFLIVNELRLAQQIFPENNTEQNISIALGNIGPSCFFSALLQVSMFLLATRVDMPAVKNFAFYSAGAVTMNFLLQMTSFISLLALDEKRRESGRLDLFPWVKATNHLHLEDHDLNTTEQDEEDIDDRGISNFISKYYAPWILSKVNSKKILGIFILWLGVSLSLLPHIKLGLDQRIAIPDDSYLIDYFNAVYQFLNVGPPIFYVLKNLDITARENQQMVCGRFSSCDQYSVANILVQEYNRGNKSTIADPATNWLDDFLNWLNPDLDQCCRFKKSSPFDQREFCPNTAPERMCQACYLDHKPPYSSTMEGLPTGKEFMFYFGNWIEQPSDPCPLGGKAPYGNSISVVDNNIEASYFRTSHSPLRSQDDFINAYKNSLRIVEEVKKYNPGIDLFAFSPFYIFFVQYQNIVSLTFSLLAVAALIIWAISTVVLGSFASATILVITVASILINIGGVMALWSISLNAVSLVNLIICVGLSVEFTIHIARAYTLSLPELLFSNEIFFGSQDTQVIKAYNALTNVGGTVLRGITLTKVIGVSVLAFSSSKIFEVFYFRMWAALVLIAAVHALCLLPILLSMFGGTFVTHRNSNVVNHIDEITNTF